MVRQGSSVGAWNTIPTSGRGFVTSRPAIRTAPPVFGLSPARIFSKVVLPHPDGPTTEMNSPRRTVRLMSLNARVGADFRGRYSLSSPSISIQESSDTDAGACVCARRAVALMAIEIPSAVRC